MLDKEVEFKSYGLYSDVAKKTDYTVDQVSTVYDWYLKQTLKKIVTEDTLQADFRNLGKFKFNPKKGLNYLNKYYDNLVRIIKFYNDSIEEDNIEKRTRVERAYIILINRFNILKPTVYSFDIRLDKLYAEGAITEDQYTYHKKRIIELINKTNQLHEPIQRISTARKERGQ